MELKELKNTSGPRVERVIKPNERIFSFTLWVKTFDWQTFHRLFFQTLRAEICFWTKSVRTLFNLESCSVFNYFMCRPPRIISSSPKKSFIIVKELKWSRPGSISGLAQFVQATIIGATFPSQPLLETLTDRSHRTLNKISLRKEKNLLLLIGIRRLANGYTNYEKTENFYFEDWKGAFICVASSSSTCE